MGESEVQAIALFFFFAFLDDRRAVDASAQTISICTEKKKKNPALNNHSLLVAATFSVWSRLRAKVQRGNANISLEGGWVLPSGLDLGPWREFQKKATQDELLVVIWSKILGVSDKDIAEGLEISEGTVRYRLGRALRKLGSMAQGVSTKKLSAVK